MNTFITTTFASLILLLSFSACTKTETVPPIKTGASLTITNTLQTAADPSAGGTGGVETPIETIFGLPAETFKLSATVNENIEFDDYLNGLYDINISENQITYNLVAPANHATYSNFYRTIEANTFDRYYLEFAEAHNIQSGSSDNNSVSLRVLSNTKIVVEIGEGFSFNPGSSFTITLQ